MTAKNVSRPWIKSSAAGGSGSECQKTSAFLPLAIVEKGHGRLFPQPASDVGSPDQADADGDRSGRWGRFIGHVVAEWLADGRDMRLVEPFAYDDAVACRWEAPAASVVNGASIPRAFWSVIGGPFAGRFRNASVVHDVACVARTRPWRQVHRMFYEACRCAETPLVQAKTMYYAVYHFGPRWQPVGRGVRDETPQPPTPDEVARIVAAFKARDVPEAVIPSLPPGIFLSGERP